MTCRYVGLVAWGVGTVLTLAVTELHVLEFADNAARRQLQTQRTTMLAPLSLPQQQQQPLQPSATPPLALIDAPRAAARVVSVLQFGVGGALCDSPRRVGGGMSASQSGVVGGGGNCVMARTVSAHNLMSETQPQGSNVQSNNGDGLAVDKETTLPTQPPSECKVEETI